MLRCHISYFCSPRHLPPPHRSTPLNRPCPRYMRTQFRLHLSCPPPNKNCIPKNIYHELMINSLGEVANIDFSPPCPSFAAAEQYVGYSTTCSKRWGEECMCVGTCVWRNGQETLVYFEDMNWKPGGQDGDFIVHPVYFENFELSTLAGWLNWLEHLPVHQSVVGSILGQGTYLGCGFDPWSRPVGEATNQCFSLASMSLSCSLYLPFPSL